MAAKQPLTKESAMGKNIFYSVLAIFFGLLGCFFFTLGVSGAAREDLGWALLSFTLALAYLCLFFCFLAMMIVPVIMDNYFPEEEDETEPELASVSE